MTNAAAWLSKRKPEVLDLFKKHVYGAIPEKPESMSVEITEADSEALGGKATHKQVRLRFDDSPTGPTINVLLYLPRGSRQKAPFPTFPGYNFDGNHTTHSDPEIFKSLEWSRNHVAAHPRVPDDSRRAANATRWPVEMILERGYALATVYYGDVDPDFYDDFRNGVHSLYPRLQNQGDNRSSIGAWAWGPSRVLDYFEEETSIDHELVAVMGHSRLGKTSLWGVTYRHGQSLEARLDISAFEPNLARAHSHFLLDPCRSERYISF